jgi:hypothetical protein
VKRLAVRSSGSPGPAEEEHSDAKAPAVNATAAGNLRIHPPGLIGPTSTINYVEAQTRANNAVIALDAQGRVGVFCGQAAGTSVDFILDVDGYFE